MSSAAMLRADLRDGIALLRRQLPLILGVGALVLALGVAALLLATPRFTATALILVDPSQKNLLSPEPARPGATGADIARVESEAGILTSAHVARATIDRLNLLADPEFGPTASPLDPFRQVLGLPLVPPHRDALLEQTLRKLAAALSVRRQARTHLLEVSLTARDPARAAQIANALSRIYIDLQIRAKTESFLSARDLLHNQIDAARARLLRSEAALEAFRQEQMTLPRDQAQLLDKVAPAAHRPRGGRDLAPARPARLSPEIMSRDSALRQEAEVSRRHYATLVSRLRDLEAQSVLQVADSRVVSEALPPQEASFPRPAIVLAISLVAALGLGTGAGLLRDYVRGGVTSLRQLDGIAPATARVAVPESHPPQPDRPVADLVIRAPMSPYAEAMRQLRAAIEQAPVRSAASDGGRVALVTSSRVGEGKSTLALALARSCAMAGQRTVLIDANLRAPSLHSTLGLCPRTGLLQYLLGEGDAEDARQGLLDDPLSGVAIFPGRGPAVQPTDRAAQSQRLDLLIGACRKVWDRIILDSAALGPVVDTRFMAPHADILVQCVGFAATPREEVVLARDQLRQAAGAGVPLVAALNRVPAAASYGKG